MKYLLLAYYDVQKWEALAQSEREAMMRECLPLDDALRQGGHLIAMEGLRPAGSALTVRVRGGKVVTSDGPYAETKEQVGGFYLIEARDFNEAIQVAANTAAARLGERPGWGVEIRPVGTIDQY